MTGAFAQERPPYDAQFAGRVALVTGGSAGIGRHAAEVFASLGMKVMIAARGAELASEVVEGIRARGGEARYEAVDVADAGQVRRLIERTTDAYGRIDFAFNNAGVALGGGVADLTE